MSYEATLDRLGAGAGGALGIFRLFRDSQQVFQCVTIENLEKRIPSGRYRMKPDNTGRHRWWTIEGDQVGLHGSGKRWQQVEVHAGNFSYQSDACMLFGAHFAELPSYDGSKLLGVADSRSTLGRLKQILGDAELDLVVSDLVANPL